MNRKTVLLFLVHESWKEDRPTEQSDVRGAAWSEEAVGQVGKVVVNFVESRKFPVKGR